MSHLVSHTSALPLVLNSRARNRYPRAELLLRHAPAIWDTHAGDRAAVCNAPSVLILSNGRPVANPPDSTSRCTFGTRRTMRWPGTRQLARSRAARARTRLSSLQLMPHQKRLQVALQMRQPQNLENSMLQASLCLRQSRHQAQ